MILSTGTAESLQMRKLKNRDFFFRITLTFNFIYPCVYQMLQSVTKPSCIKNLHAIEQYQMNARKTNLTFRAFI